MKLFGSRKAMGFDAFFQEGLRLYQSGRLNEALNYFTDAINIRSDIPEVYYQRAMTLARMGDLNSACRDFETVYQLGSYQMRRDACYNLGKAYDQLNRLEDSLRWYDRCLQMDENNANAYTNRAGVHSKLGEMKSDAREFELALSDLTNALQLNPSDALAYFNRAIIYKTMQKYDLIEGDLRSFLRYAPSNHPYRADAERLLAGLEKPLPSKVEMVREQNQQALLEKIVQLNNEEHYSEAVACCDEFLAQKRTEATVWDEKAFALWALGRQPEALEVCREGIATNPNGARLYHTMGGLLSEIGRYREALGAFEKYLAIAPPAYAPNFPGVEKEIARIKQILGINS